MLKATGTGYLFCLAMYVAIGLCGYFTWKELTVSDILIMYGTENILIFVCRVFVDLTVLFSIPIVIFFGRKGFFSMVSRPRSEGPQTLDEIEPESQRFTSQPIDITTSCELSKNNSKPSEPLNKTLY